MHTRLFYISILCFYLIISAPSFSSLLYHFARVRIYLVPTLELLCVPFPLALELRDNSTLPFRNSWAEFLVSTLSYTASLERRRNFTLRKGCTLNFTLYRGLYVGPVPFFPSNLAAKLHLDKHTKCRGLRFFSFPKLTRMLSITIRWMFSEHDPQSLSQNDSLLSATPGGVRSVFCFGSPGQPAHCRDVMPKPGWLADFAPVSRATCCLKQSLGV